MFAYLSPEWFSGYNIVTELMIGIVSTIVFFQALKVYKLSKLKQVGFFCISFMFIAIANLYQTIVDIYIHVKMSVIGVCAHGISAMNALEIFSMYVYMILMLAGLVLLVFMTLKTKSTKSLILIYGLSLIALFLASSPVLIFYALEILFFAFLVAHFLVNYKKHPNLASFLILTAFCLLLLSSAELFFAINSPIMFMYGRILDFIAFLLISINLFLVWRSK